MFCRLNILSYGFQDHLGFDEQVITRAKAFAEQHNISLSRLTEFLLTKVVDKKYRSLDELPVSDWVSMVSEGQAEYVRKNAAGPVRKAYLESRRPSKRRK